MARPNARRHLGDRRNPRRRHCSCGLRRPIDAGRRHGLNDDDAPPSPAPRPAAVARAPGLLAYASCMRSHGVPNFPDPGGKGGIPKASPRQRAESGQQFAGSGGLERLPRPASLRRLEWPARPNDPRPRPAGLPPRGCLFALARDHQLPRPGLLRRQRPLHHPPEHQYAFDAVQAGPADLPKAHPRGTPRQRVRRLNTMTIPALVSLDRPPTIKQQLPGSRGLRRTWGSIPLALSTNAEIEMRVLVVEDCEALGRRRRRGAS